MTVMTKAQYARDLIERQETTSDTVPEDSSSTSSTSTTSAMPPPPTATLIIHDPTNLSTCQTNAIIVWDYAGPSTAQLTLSLTDVNVSQSTSATPPPTILKMLGGNIDASVGNWSWQQVDVPSGYYFVEGAVLNANATTDTFFIANGSDTSCLGTQTSTPSQTPVSSSSSKKTNAAAIAGGTVGGVVVIAIAVVALLLWRKSKRSRSRRGAAVGRWGGLGSSGSGGPFLRDKTIIHGSNHVPSESMGGILNDIGPAINSAARIDSRDEITLAEDEKSPFTPVNQQVPVLPYKTPQRRSSTTSSYHNHPTPSLSEHDHAIPRAAFDSEGRRRGSVDVADFGSSLAAPGTRLSYSAKRKSGSPQTETFPMDRTASGPRRASRKPVPQYDATEIDVRSSIEMPPYELSSMNHRQSHHSTANLPNGSKRKSTSTGVRPMHYLIPDLPPAGST